MQFVVIAGGLGARAKSDTPKILVEFDSVPLLKSQLNCFSQMKSEQINVIYLLGIGADEVISCIGREETMRNFPISYQIERVNKGPGGALLQSLEFLENEFIVVLGDLYFDFDFDSLILFCREKDADFVAVVHPNGHSFDSDTISAHFEDKRISKINFKSDFPKEFSPLANAGIYYIKKSMLNESTKLTMDSEIDILKDVISTNLINSTKSYIYNTFEYIRDSGTPERRNLITTEIKKNIPFKRSRRHSKPTLFFDRDSTIMPDPYTFEYFPSPAFVQALIKINELHIPTIVVSNQPRIAKGASFEDLMKENSDFEAKLELLGAKIDAWYFCPHHPEAGFFGERTEYKIECSCRKPGVTLFKNANQEHKLDLMNSNFIGDSMVDFEACEQLRIRFFHTSEFKSCTFEFKHRCFSSTAEAILASIGEL
jgi:histidinol-phosphate phosphatase family protein